MQMRTIGAKQLFKNILSQWFFKVARLLISIAATIVIARVLGPEGYGVVTSVLVLSSPFDLILDPGFSQSVVRYISIYYGSGRDYRLIFAGFAVYSTVTGLLSALAFYLLAPFLASLAGLSTYVNIFRVYSITIFLRALINIFDTYFYGVNRIDLAILYYSVGFAIGQLMSLSLVLLGFGIMGCILGYITMPVTTIMLYVTRHSFLLRDLFRVPLYEALREFKTTIPLTISVLISQIASYVYTWLDKILVLSFLGAYALGLYTVALRFAGIFEDLLTSIGQVITPYYGIIYGADGLDALKRKIWRVSRILSLFFVPPLMLIAPLTSHLILLMYGEDFAQSWIVALTHLLYLAVIGPLVGYSGVDLILEARRVIILRSILAFTSSIALELLLIKLGLNSLGIILGRDLGQVIGIIYTYIVLFARQRLNFDIYLWGKSLFVGGLLTALLTCAVVSISQLWPVWLCITALAYLATLRRLRLVEREDIKVLREITPSRFLKLVNIIEKVTISQR